MNKDELWKIYCNQNNELTGESKFEISPQGMKKMFELTYDKAYAQGREDAERMKDFHNNTGNIFNDIFKG